MIKSDSVAELQELIRLKQIEHQLEELLLKETFHATYESMKPINLLKKTIRQAIASPELKADLGSAALGLASGFLAKKAIGLGSKNPLIKLAAIVVQMVVARKVTQNADEIKSVASIVLNKILNHRRSESDEIPNK